MKVLNGISVVALLLAGAATPSFATSLIPGGMVVPNTVAGNGGILADTGVIPFSFGGDTGNVIGFVTNSWTTSPFAGDITFVYQIQVTAGNIVNLTSQSFNIPGLMLDVQQENACNGLFTCSGSLVPAVNASWTSNGQVVGFGFTPPNGLTSGMTSYELIVNTNLTTYEAGMFSLQDGQTENFQGFVPVATPEPGSLALLGTGLLGVAGLARRKFFHK